MLANSALTSSFMPLTMKKNGMKTPKATAVSFGSKAGISRLRGLTGDQPRREPAQQQVQPEFEGQQRQREDEHDDQPDRQLGAPSIVRSKAAGGSAERTPTTATATASAMKVTSIGPLWTGPASRGSTSAAGSGQTRHSAGRKQVGAEPVLSSPASESPGSACRSPLSPARTPCREREDDPARASMPPIE